MIESHLSARDTCAPAFQKRGTRGGSLLSLLIVSALLLFASSVFGQSVTSARIVDLSGNWKYARLSDTESGPWNVLRVPGELPTARAYSLRKYVNVPEADRDLSWSLHISNVGGAATLLLNGKVISANIGESIETEVPLSFRAGRNKLEILVDGRTGNTRIPSFAHSLAPAERLLVGHIELRSGSGPHSAVAISSRLSVSTDGKLVLDGAPFDFRSTTVAIDPSTDLGLLRTELAGLKSAGGNAVRFLSLTNNTQLSICDSLGLIAFVELPLAYQASNEFNDELLANAESALDRYFESLSQHPSLAAVGLGDCNSDRLKPAQTFYASLRKHITDIQKGLLTYYVTRYPNDASGFDFAALSVLGLDNQREAQEAIRKFSLVQRGHRPYLLLGAGVCLDQSHAQQSGLAQAKILARQFDLCRIEGYSGFSAGTLSDYRSGWPNILSGGEDPSLVTTGLYDLRGHQRDGLTELSALYLGEHSPLRFSSAEKETGGPMSYLLYGFFLLFLFFLLMNVDRRFREYVTRALMRPYNFFADIRDQRLIPNVQTAILGLVLAGSVALFLASLLESSRDGYFANWLLGIVFSPGMHAWLAKMAWSYNQMVMWFTLILFGVLLAITLIVRFASIFVRGRLFLSDTFNVVVWAVLPLIFLIPYDLLLPRLDKTVASVTTAFVILGLMLLWSFYRLLKGTGVLFDVYPTKLYIYGGLGIALFVAFFAFYLDHGKNIFSNYSFYRSVVSATELRP